MWRQRQPSPRAAHTIGGPPPAHILNLTTMRDWILVTGQPGAGKTTAVRKMVDYLIQNGVKCRGFYTDEVKDGSHRIGFDIVTVPEGHRAPLSRMEGYPTSFPTVGKYRVNVESIDELAAPSLELEEGVVLVLDEVGRMELKSERFRAQVERLLESPTVRLIGAITAPRYGHRVPFCDQISSSDGVQVYNLKKSNRDDVTDDLLAQIQDRWLPLS